MSIWNHLRFFLMMMVMTMTPAMMTIKTATTIMIVVVLLFLGSAPRGVTLFSQIIFGKSNQYKQVKVKLSFRQKQNTKYKWIKQYHLQRMSKTIFTLQKTFWSHKPSSVTDDGLYDWKYFYKVKFLFIIDEWCQI